MTRPKPKKPPVVLEPHEDPDHPDYISPAEERRLRRQLLRRIDNLFEVAAIKGYGPIPDQRLNGNITTLSKQSCDLSVLRSKGGNCTP